MAFSVYAASDSRVGPWKADRSSLNSTTKRLSSAYEQDSIWSKVSHTYAYIDPKACKIVYRQTLRPLCVETRSIALWRTMLWT